MPSGPKKRKNAKKKKETALHVGAPTNIPEEVGGDEVKVVLEKSGGGGLVLGRDDDGNDEDASWNSKQTNPDSSNSTIGEGPRLRCHDSIGETVEAVEVLRMDEKGERLDEAAVIAQGLGEKKDDAVEGVERVEDGKASVGLVEPPNVDDEKGGSSSSSRSSSSSSSDDGGSDSDRDEESEKQEVLSSAPEESEKPEVLSGALQESEKPEDLSGAMNAEKPEVLSGALDESEKPEVLSGSLDESEKLEVLSGDLENSENSEFVSGAVEEPKKLEVLSSAPEVVEETYRIDIIKVEVPIENSGLESTIEVEKVTTVESVNGPDAASSSIESEKEVTVKSIDNPGPENSIESAREAITETLAMSSSTEVRQEVEQQVVIVDATDKPIVDPSKDHEKPDKIETECSIDVTREHYHRQLYKELPGRVAADYLTFF